MTGRLFDQRAYWNREVSSFDSIYSDQKSAASKLLDSLFRWDMYARFDYTLSHVAPIENKSFLDIGCGTGRYALELVRRGARRVVGLDISENMVNVCRERSKEQGYSDKTLFLHTDLLQYNSGGRFDVSIGIGLFDYIRDPLPVLRKMHSHTETCSILSFPRLLTWRAPVRRCRLYLRKCDVFFYTKSRVVHLLKSAGFLNYDMEKIGNLYCVTAYPK